MLAISDQLTPSALLTLCKEPERGAAYYGEGRLARWADEQPHLLVLHQALVFVKGARENDAIALRLPFIFYPTGPVQAIEIEEVIDTQIILDNFLALSASQSMRVRLEDDILSPSDMEVKHDEPSAAGLIITEAMARIYLRQGQRGKAKAILDRLILKNPAKSAYFTEILTQELPL